MLLWTYSVRDFFQVAYEWKRLKLKKMKSRLIDLVLSVHSKHCS